MTHNPALGIDRYFDADQLYDLEADPKEQRNLAGKPEHAEKLEEMKAELQQYLKKLPGSFGELKPRTSSSSVKANNKPEQTAAMIR